MDTARSGLLLWVARDDLRRGVHRSERRCSRRRKRACCGVSAGLPRWTAGKSIEVKRVYPLALGGAARLGFQVVRA